MRAPKVLQTFCDSPPEGLQGASRLLLSAAAAPPAARPVQEEVRRNGAGPAKNRLGGLGMQLSPPTVFCTAMVLWLSARSGATNDGLAEEGGYERAARRAQPASTLVDLESMSLRMQPEPRVNLGEPAAELSEHVLPACALPMHSSTSVQSASRSGLCDSGQPP